MRISMSARAMSVAIVTLGALGSSACSAGVEDGAFVEDVGEAESAIGATECAGATPNFTKRLARSEIYLDYGHAANYNNAGCSKAFVYRFDPPDNAAYEYPVLISYQGPALTTVTACESTQIRIIAYRTDNNVKLFDISGAGSFYHGSCHLSELNGVAVVPSRVGVKFAVTALTGSTVQKYNFATQARFKFNTPS